MKCLCMRDLLQLLVTYLLLLHLGVLFSPHRIPLTRVGVGLVVGFNVDSYSYTLHRSLIDLHLH